MKFILIGFMGSGKSTVGKQLAAELRWTFTDSDAWIEDRAKVSVSRIFETGGESEFRKWELQFAEQLDGKEEVIACGGGLPCHNDLITVLKEKGTVVYLKTSAETLIGRLKEEREERPLLASLSDDLFAKEITSRLEARKSIYQQADLVVETDGKTIQEIIDVILFSPHRPRRKHRI